jgi:hypothetical protein
MSSSAWRASCEPEPLPFEALLDLRVVDGDRVSLELVIDRSSEPPAYADLVARLLRIVLNRDRLLVRGVGHSNRSTTPAILANTSLMLLP